MSSKFEGYQKLPSVMEQMETLMEEKFYHPETHVFTVEEEAEKAEPGDVQDSRSAAEDSRTQKGYVLRLHGIIFAAPPEKYQENGQFSAMYIKFVFSNVIQELFRKSFWRRACWKEIERLYNCSNISQT